MKQSTFKPNGSLAFELGMRFAWQNLTFLGGPFDQFANMPDPNKFGVCVREEAVPKQRDVLLPIRDYSIPRDREAVTEAVIATLEAALAGKSVYIGCMGGWGRTGLFMAIIAKALGVPDPVAYVRADYTPHAVETKEQQAYVMNFDVSEIQRWMVRASWKARIKRLFGR